MEYTQGVILSLVLFALNIEYIFARTVQVHDDTNTRFKRHATLDNSKICKAFGCVNGHCKDGEIRNFRIVCECFPGYEGKLCDKLKCPYDCGQHGTCARKGHVMYCKCDRGYHGARCDTFLKPMALQSSVAPTSLLKAFGGIITSSGVQVPPRDAGNAMSLGDTRSWFNLQARAVPQIKFTDFHSHAEIDTSVKPEVCAPGFQCYHGQCDREAMAFGVFQCLCKANFTGLFCEKRCTLNCQNDGKCMVLQDGHQFCSCPFNFTGHYCQTPL